LDFSSIEAGKISLDRVPFSLQDSVASVIAWFRPGAEAKGVRLEVEVSGNIPQFVMGDPPRLRQILFNLLSNGIKFTEAGAVRLEVSLTCGSPSETALLFRVADTGAGIAPGIQARLFTPFMQADAASTRRHGGVGLGLATARRLVQLMGGAIGMESQPGKGSVFWFMLPLERAPAPESIPPASTIDGPPQLKHGHVLVVDDNPINQLVAARAVTRLGYLAEVVSGGEQALEAIAQRAFEAVLLDCQMPGMDGYQTAAEIRRREAPSRRIPIIALTANTAEADVQRCLFSGMDDFLSKTYHRSGSDPGKVDPPWCA
jgi:CheY-like chemotaxis protein